MRRAVLALTAILIIVFLMAPIAQVTVVEANPSMLVPNIRITSPQDYKQKIYQNTTIPLVIEIYAINNHPNIVDITYSLDGSSKTALSFHSNVGNFDYSGTGSLENLTNGYHSVKAYATDIDGKVISTNMTFLVDTNFKHPTSTLSPTPTSTIPEFSWLIILPLFAIMLFVTMRFKTRSRNVNLA